MAESTILNPPLSNPGPELVGLRNDLHSIQEPPQDLGTPELDVDEVHLSLAERRPRRETRRLPARFRDTIPQNLAALPPSATAVTRSLSMVPEELQPQDPSGMAADPNGSGHQILKSSRNVFGLFRQYRALDFPLHDPDEYTTLDDLSDHDSNNFQPPPPAQSFDPFPNHSSFRLGEWYWNRGIQKSQADFKELVDIIAHPSFHATDVQNTKWDLINHQLAGHKSEEEEWIDEDAGWTRTPVTIRAPFHRFTADPGYVVAELHHRHIVSIVREKLTNHDSRHFHFEPYQLQWQPGDMPDPVRVHGELYTSSAFISAHEQLQDSPREPGCDLPRVIALMFASDETHLTSFGNTKLWPLYLFFGNESKYRRCKPSCHLCNHVAYFQRVSSIMNPVIPVVLLMLFLAS
jgi:hypothetical protein